ncbi:signal peptidase I [Buchnera aphidicola]|uniref:signal peptidase I n=1 Tax=Buchnera aphidicola TaxID=9 RepID=UPI0012AC13A3
MKKLLIELIQYFLIIVFIFSIQLFFFQSFSISSNSMKPSLFEGDYILVQKLFYNTQNLNKKIKFNSYKPKRNDVVVFKYPKNKNLKYIKRIIGLPGDIVFYHPFTKKIYIFNKINNKYSIIKKKKKEIKYIISNQIKNNKKFYNKNIHTYRSLIKESYKEIFKNHVHDIIVFHGIKNYLYLYNIKNKNQKKWTWIIPKDQYFVIGDNRDKSSDSRFWGLVKKENILGKAKYIWFSMNYKSKKWFHIIYFRRIFKKIQ